MDKNTLFGKTAAGREALTTRPAGLGPRLRALLIMVDGKRNLAEFEKLSGSLEQATQSLNDLMTAGWVEMVGADGLPKAAPPAAVPARASFEPVAAPSAPVAAAATASVTTLPFSEARRLVVRFINDQLGPMGETLAIRAESCKTPADLQAALPRIREGLKSFKGSSVVQQFDEEIADRLPKV
jgi:predicted regulator of Ras-like GTPase activity (Roadblock/LC7/MglB family)